MNHYGFRQVLSAIWATSVKEMRLLLRDPGGLIMLFVLPVIFIVALSVALQGAFSSGKEVDKLGLALLSEDTGHTGKNIAQGIKDAGLFRLIDLGPNANRATAEKGLRDGSYNIVVVVPRDAGRALAFEEDRTVDVILDPVISQEFARATTSTIQSIVHSLALEDLATRLEKSQTDLGKAKADAASAAGRNQGELSAARAELVAVRAQLAAAQTALKRMASAPPGQPPPGGPGGPPPINIPRKKIVKSEASSKEIVAAAKPVLLSSVDKMLRVKQSYAAQANAEIRPNSVQQNVPGWTIFALFWLAQLLALNIVSERSSGIHTRLLAAPLSPTAYLIGKLLPFLLINLLQAVLMFSVGVYLLPRLGCARLVITQPAPLIVLTLAISLVSIAFGLLMASVSRSSLMVAVFTAAILIIMTIIGGIMVPKYIMPISMQRLSLLVPHGWALDGYLKILVKGQGTRQILREIGVLLGFAAAFFTFAMWRLRRRSY